MDLSWQDVFQTNDKSKVELFCRENALHFEWLSNDTLRTEQICPGVATHPLTGEVVFFNQAHLFHPSSLGAAMEQDLIDLFGASKLPRNARYGDDGEIATEDLDAIRAAFNAEAVNIEWQAGDVVVLDNMIMAHGRRPFSGDRRILASLLNKYSPN
jgi:alpha-ketoglutarate-dependent taurine dioxygenase